jgi:hypothetical protein
VRLAQVRDRLVQARRVRRRAGELDRAEQAPRLRERRIQPHGFPRLAGRLFRDVQVPEELGILVTDDRIVGQLFDHLPVEVEGLPVAAVADGHARLQIQFSPFQDRVRRERCRKERRDEKKGWQPDFHVLQCSTPATGVPGRERAYAPLPWSKPSNRSTSSSSATPRPLDRARIAPELPGRTAPDGALARDFG